MAVLVEGDEVMWLCVSDRTRRGAAEQAPQISPTLSAEGGPRDGRLASAGEEL